MCSDSWKSILHSNATRAEVPSSVNRTSVGPPTGLFPAAGTPTRLALYLPNTSANLIPTASAFCLEHVCARCPETPGVGVSEQRAVILHWRWAPSPSQRRSRTNRGRLTTIYRSLLSYLATGRRWRQGNYGVGVDGRVGVGWGGGVVVCSRKMDWKLGVDIYGQFEKHLNVSRWKLRGRQFRGLTAQCWCSVLLGSSKVINYFFT